MKKFEIMDPWRSIISFDQLNIIMEFIKAQEEE